MVRRHCFSCWILLEGGKVLTEAHQNSPPSSSVLKLHEATMGGQTEGGREGSSKSTHLEHVLRRMSLGMYKVVFLHQ